MSSFDLLSESAPPVVKQEFPGLRSLRERPDFHPEENALEHIRIVTDRLASTKNPNLTLAGFFHDIFKARTAVINPRSGWPTSPGHDKAAARLVRTDDSVQEFIRNHGGDPETVAQLCEQHMRIKQINQMRPSKQRALQELNIFPLLQIFTRADDMLEEFIP